MIAVARLGSFEIRFLHDSGGQFGVGYEWRIEEQPQLLFASLAAPGKFRESQREREIGERVEALSQPGVDVKTGDYLLAVNGVALDTAKDPWAAFQGLAPATLPFL